MVQDTHPARQSSHKTKVVGTLPCQAVTQWVDRGGSGREYAVLVASPGAAVGEDRPLSSARGTQIGTQPFERRTLVLVLIRPHVCIPCSAGTTNSDEPATCVDAAIRSLTRSSK
jgi:hypothetical protein